MEAIFEMITQLELGQKCWEGKDKNELYSLLLCRRDPVGLKEERKVLKEFILRERL